MLRLTVISSRNLCGFYSKVTTIRERRLFNLGTEDEEIHCLKEGGVAADARESIWRDTATLATAMDTEFNPFTDV